MIRKIVIFLLILPLCFSLQAMSGQKIWDTITYKNDIGQIVYKNVNNYPENSIEFRQDVEKAFCKLYDHQIKNIIFKIEETGIDKVGNLVITKRTFDTTKILQQNIPIGFFLLSSGYFGAHLLGMLIATLDNF